MRAAALALAAITALTFPASAAAHVLLSPNTAAPHSFMLYTVLSPNERESPLTGLSLTIPESLEVDLAGGPPCRSLNRQDRAIELRFRRGLAIDTKRRQKFPQFRENSRRIPSGSKEASV